MPLYASEKAKVLRLLRTGGFEAILTCYTDEEGQHLYVYDRISKNLIVSYVTRVHKVPLPVRKAGRFEIVPVKKIRDRNGGVGKMCGNELVLTGQLYRILATHRA